MEQKFPRRYFASTNFSFRFFFLFLFSLSHIFHSHFSSRRKRGRKGHEGQRTTQRYSTSRIELINRISREYRLAREGDISTHMFVFLRTCLPSRFISPRPCSPVCHRSRKSHFSWNRRCHRTRLFPPLSKRPSRCALDRFLNGFRLRRFYLRMADINSNLNSSKLTRLFSFVCDKVLVDFN